MALSGDALATAILLALDGAGVFDPIEDDAQREEVKAKTAAAWRPVASAIVAHIQAAGVVTIEPGAEVRNGEVLLGAVTGTQTGSIG